jgi:hypothetical protein
VNVCLVIQVGTRDKDKRVCLACDKADTTKSGVASPPNSPGSELHLLQQLHLSGSSDTCKVSRMAPKNGRFCHQLSALRASDEEAGDHSLPQSNSLPASFEGTSSCKAEAVSCLEPAEKDFSRPRLAGSSTDVHVECERGCELRTAVHVRHAGCKVISKAATSISIIERVGAGLQLSINQQTDGGHGSLQAKILEQGDASLLEEHSSITGPALLQPAQLTSTQHNDNVLLLKDGGGNPIGPSIEIKPMCSNAAQQKDDARIRTAAQQTDAHPRQEACAQQTDSIIVLAATQQTDAKPVQLTAAVQTDSVPMLAVPQQTDAGPVQVAAGQQTDVALMLAAFQQTDTSPVQNFTVAERPEIVHGLPDGSFQSTNGQQINALPAQGTIADQIADMPLIGGDAAKLTVSVQTDAHPMQVTLGQQTDVVSILRNGILQSTAAQQTDFPPKQVTFACQTNELLIPGVKLICDRPPNPPVRNTVAQQADAALDSCVVQLRAAKLPDDRTSKNGKAMHLTVTRKTGDTSLLMQDAPLILPQQSSGVPIITLQGEGSLQVQQHPSCDSRSALSRPTSPADGLAEPLRAVASCQEGGMSATMSGVLSKTCQGALHSSSIQQSPIDAKSAVLLQSIVAQQTEGFLEELHSQSTRQSYAMPKVLGVKDDELVRSPRELQSKVSDDPTDHLLRFLESGGAQQIGVLYKKLELAVAQQTNDMSCQPGGAIEPAIYQQVCVTADAEQPSACAAAAKVAVAQGPDNALLPEPVAMQAMVTQAKSNMSVEELRVFNCPAQPTDGVIFSDRESVPSRIAQRLDASGVADNRSASGQARATGQKDGSSGVPQGAETQQPVAPQQSVRLLGEALNRSQELLQEAPGAANCLQVVPTSDSSHRRHLCESHSDPSTKVNLLQPDCRSGPTQGVKPQQPSTVSTVRVTQTGKAPKPVVVPVIGIKMDQSVRGPEPDVFCSGGNVSVQSTLSQQPEFLPGTQQAAADNQVDSAWIRVQRVPHCGPEQQSVHAPLIMVGMETGTGQQLPYFLLLEGVSQPMGQTYGHHMKEEEVTPERAAAREIVESNKLRPLLMTGRDLQPIASCGTNGLMFAARVRNVQQNSVAHTIDERAMQGTMDKHVDEGTDASKEASCQHMEVFESKSPDTERLSGDMPVNFAEDIISQPHHIQPASVQKDEYDPSLSGAHVRSEVCRQSDYSLGDIGALVPQQTDGVETGEERHLFQVFAAPVEHTNARLTIPGCPSTTLLPMVNAPVLDRSPTKSAAQQHGLSLLQAKLSQKPANVLMNRPVVSHAPCGHVSQTGVTTLTNEEGQNTHSCAPMSVMTDQDAAPHQHIDLLTRLQKSAQLAGFAQSRCSGMFHNLLLAQPRPLPSEVRNCTSKSLHC